MVLIPLCSLLQVFVNFAKKQSDNLEQQETSPACAMESPLQRLLNLLRPRAAPTELRALVVEEPEDLETDDEGLISFEEERVRGGQGKGGWLPKIDGAQHGLSFCPVHRLSSLSTLTRSAETWRGCSPSPGFGTTGSLSLDACLPRPSSSTDLRRAVVGSEMAGGAWLGGPVASIGSWQGVRDASLHQPGQPHRGEAHLARKLDCKPHWIWRNPSRPFQKQTSRRRTLFLEWPSWRFGVEDAGFGASE